MDKFLKNKWLKLTVLSESYDTTNYDIDHKVKKIAQEFWIHLQANQTVFSRIMTQIETL